MQDHRPTAISGLVFVAEGFEIVYPVDFLAGRFGRVQRLPATGFFCVAAAKRKASDAPQQA
jgi:hypothetical protein